MWCKDSWSFCSWKSDLGLGTCTAPCRGHTLCAFWRCVGARPSCVSILLLLGYKLSALGQNLKHYLLQQSYTVRDFLYFPQRKSVSACQRPVSRCNESLLWPRAQTSSYQKECIYVGSHNYSPHFPADPSFVLTVSAKVCMQPGLSWLVTPLTR